MSLTRSETDTLTRAARNEGGVVDNLDCHTRRHLAALGFVYVEWDCATTVARVTRVTITPAGRDAVRAVLASR